MKGVQFVGLRDAGDPVELASRYYEEGADELVFLDISASHQGVAPVIHLAERVAEAVFIPFTVGGGLRDPDAIRDALLAGADKVSLNSAALLDADLISRCADRFGSQCIVLAIDAKRETDGWHVYSHGGRNDTGRQAVEWAAEGVSRGAGEILLTSMDADGSQAGYDLELTRAVAEAVNVPVIASGGAGKPEDLVEAVTKGNADAVLVAGIVHSGRYSIHQLKQAMHEHGLPVRLA
ncbi:MAG: Imidazole glycerol phosphate synthase subunit HisF [Fimbriimonadaceae bacterium]|nr:Imidazole glycerol phosphate synthase subunit HisF [Fimbriimonadaceae bacterium]